MPFVPANFFLKHGTIMEPLNPKLSQIQQFPPTALPRKPTIQPSQTVIEPNPQPPQPVPQEIPWWKRHLLH